MSYPEPPDASKTKIRKAGKRLASADSTVAEVREAQLLVDQFRAAHQWPMLTARVTLSERAKRISEDALVVQRLKRMPSILEKLQSGRVKDVSSMQDLGGCRAIMPSISEVRKLADMYETGSRNSVFSFQLRNNYIENPKPNGYRGLHFVGTYSSEKQPKYSGYSIELQLRTQLMHSWATSVEIVDTFEQVGLKSSRPEDFNTEWDFLFAYAGAAIAITEGTPVPPGMPESREAISAALKEINADRMLRRITSWSSSIRFVSKLQGRGSYFLLSLDPERKSIRARRFKSPSQAEEHYRNIESEHRANTVLVGGHSMEDIKKAYPNYFADTHRLTRLVRSILRNQSPS